MENNKWSFIKRAILSYKFRMTEMRILLIMFMAVFLSIMSGDYFVNIEVDER